jgi:hypothetical protein
MHEPDDPDPKKHYKMTAHTWWLEEGERGRGTLAPLFSKDGYRWQLAIDTPPVHGLLPVEAILLPKLHFEAAGGLYKWNNMYYASGQQLRDAHPVHVSGREVTLFRSVDFVKWSTTKTLAFTREGQHKEWRAGWGEETHEGISVWNRGNVLIGLSGIWHGGTDWSFDKSKKADIAIDLGFVISNDGLHFREPMTEMVYMERGPDGAWDQGGLLQGQGFANIDDQTYIWYGAWDPRPHNPYVPRGGLGLATLPRDRFGSMAVADPIEQGILTSSLIYLTGKARLTINAAGLSDKSYIKIQLLDEKEKPIPGYENGRLSLSGYSQPVTWSDQNIIKDINHPFKIKLIFEGKNREQIDFYTLYMGTVNQ